MKRAAGWCLLLSVLGLICAGYLTYMHLGLMRGELLGGAACGGEGVFNCHAVTASRWGSFLGVPLSLWGSLGYLIILSLAALAFSGPDWLESALTLIGGLSLLFVGIDAYLLSVMAFNLHYFCLFCLVSYGVNILLVAISTVGLGKNWAQIFAGIPGALAALLSPKQRAGAGLFWALVFVSTLGVAGVYASTTFVIKGSLKSMRPQVREFVHSQQRVNVDTAGDPVKGNPQAAFRLVEFSDFLCPVCQRASKLNEVLLAGHQDDVAFIFKQYPLDMECNPQVQRTVHPGACKLAAAAECAQMQGNFWRFHDKIFGGDKPYEVKNLDHDLPSLGLDLKQFQSCMASGEGAALARKDIDEGSKLGVTSTPTFVLNGILMRGSITPTAFEDLLAVIEESHR